MKTGRKVKMVIFNSQEQLQSTDEFTLEILNEYHGTYDLDWILQKDAMGKEIGRHNVQSIESIIWEETPMLIKKIDDYPCPNCGKNTLHYYDANGIYACKNCYYQCDSMDD